MSSTDNDGIFAETTRRHGKIGNGRRQIFEIPKIEVEIPAKKNQHTLIKTNYEYLELSHRRNKKYFRLGY